MVHHTLASTHPQNLYGTLLVLSSSDPLTLANIRREKLIVNSQGNNRGQGCHSVENAAIPL